MDFKNPEWFGAVELTGVREPAKFAGSPQSMLRNMLAYMQLQHPRVNAAGYKEFVFTFRTIPVESTAKEDHRADEVLELIGDQYVDFVPGPNDGESADNYYDRLIAAHYTHGEAVTWVRLNMGVELDLTQTAWMQDERAAKFRELNASNRARESADPHEFKALMDYCKSKYPEQVKALHG